MPNVLSNTWSNGINFTLVAIQPGGAGYPLQLLSVQHAVDAISGGGRAVSSRRIRQSNRGRPAYNGKIVDDSIQSFTGTLTVTTDSTARKTLGFFEAPEEFIMECDSPTTYNIWIFYNCADIDGTIYYEQSKVWVDVQATSFGYSGNLKNGADNGENTNTPIYKAISGDGYPLLETSKLKSRNTSAGNTNVAINKVIYRGWQTYYAVTDADTGNQCYLAYSENDGASWTFDAITTLATLSDTATDITRFGSLHLIASPTDGITYFTTPASGAPAAYTAATLAGVTWATNFPSAVTAPTGIKAIAVGAGGRIFESNNGSNFTEPSASASATTEDLSIALTIDPIRAVFGGTNAGILRWQDGVYDAITAGGGITGTDTITAMATPNGNPYRTLELYVGTSGGDIAYTSDITAASPTWTAVTIPGITGTGSIDDIQFDATGTYMFILHTTGGNSTWYRDLSGGNGANDVETITSPTTSTYNSGVARSHKHLVTVGEVNNSLGFTGLITE